MRCRVPILLCALLVCSTALGAAPVAGQQQPDGTHLDAQLETDGDAAWNVTVRIPIDGEGQREDFESFASDFEAGESSFGLGASAFEQAAAEAGAASGREMSITSIRREGEVVTDAGTEGTEAQYGVLRLSFTWESFARVDEEGVVYVDDAFNTTDGTWLPGLGANQSLTIRAPPGYGGPTTSPIGAEDGNLHWEGPATFEPGYFSIVYHPGATGAAEEGGELPTALVGAAVLLSVAALSLGVYLLLARRRGSEVPPEDGETPATVDPSEGTESPAPAAPRTAEETGKPEGTESGTETTDRPESSAETDESEEPDFDLLSDEEQVEYLLEQNGGRMKQATIVKETGWSNAKVSQLLSSMDEQDRIDKLRIGRENLISLPGEGVGDIDGDSES